MTSDTTSSALVALKSLGMVWLLLNPLVSTDCYAASFQLMPLPDNAFVFDGYRISPTGRFVYGRLSVPDSSVKGFLWDRYAAIGNQVQLISSVSCSNKDTAVHSYSEHRQLMIALEQCQSSGARMLVYFKGKPAFSLGYEQGLNFRDARISDNGHVIVALAGYPPDNKVLRIKLKYDEHLTKVEVADVHHIGTDPFAFESGQATPPALNFSDISSDGALIYGSLLTTGVAGYDVKVAQWGASAQRWSLLPGQVGKSFGLLQVNGRYALVSAQKTNETGILSTDGDYEQLSAASGEYRYGGINIALDGNTVIGARTRPGSWTAMIWRRGDGWRDLTEYFVNDLKLGSELSGWSVRNGFPTRMSADGRTLVGVVISASKVSKLFAIHLDN